jgi:methylisocitrate lyase
MHVASQLASIPPCWSISTPVGGGAFNIARTIKEMIRAGVAAVHIEDQVAQKRCGHRPNKEIVSVTEMVDRVKAAVDAKTDPDFVLMARTDSLQSEGLQGVIDRACAYVEAGADAIFAEAMTDLSMYKQVCDAVKVPVLANITEFGTTPYYTAQELGEQGIAMVLYPLSPTRAMQKAALEVMKSIRENGTQTGVLDLMQTRKDLYQFLDYQSFEDQLDRLFAAKKG